MNKWVVVDELSALRPGEIATVLGEFDSEETAAQFIATLPDYESGRYGLDGSGEEL